MHETAPIAPRLQYQSFPDTGGDSDSLKKLKALLLPALAHKKFLDIGCNEGFFCGYALHDGAQRVVGLDMSPTFIARASQRFPAAEFLCQSWDELPAETFDVILLASSLHYASDQAALIARLMQMLNPDGTLVLELGVDADAGNQLVQVNRGIDVRSFPTWSLLAEMLAPYAWKNIGKSVNQSGDPVSRHVIHITHRKPLVYLMMQVPGSGKSAVANTLFLPAGVPTISGDATMVDIAAGRSAATAALKALLGPSLDHTRLDQAYQQILKAGLATHLVGVWQAHAQGRSFALDAFIPVQWHDQIEAAFIAAGYLVVKLVMSGVNLLESQHLRHSSAEMYFRKLNNIEVPHTGNTTSISAKTRAFVGTVGFIDTVKGDARFLKVSGWAAHQSGLAPAYVDLRIDGQSMAQQFLFRFPRPDLPQKLHLLNDLVGFHITIPTPPLFLVDSQLANRVQVFAGESKETANKPLWSLPAGIMPDQLPY